MSELSHEVGNGHRILTIPDFKLNFARREANQAGGQQHQTSQARSLRLVTSNQRNQIIMRCLSALTA